MAELKILNFRWGRHAPTSRNGKCWTSLRAYSVFFPSGPISVPDKKFSFQSSRPKKHFYMHKSLNLLSVLWIQYMQWKADIQCQLKLNFFDHIQSIIQDYGLRKRHYLIYFSVLDFFLFSLNFNFSFPWTQPFHIKIIFWSFYIEKILMLTLARGWWTKISLFVKTFLRLYNCWTSCYK